MPTVSPCVCSCSQVGQALRSVDNLGIIRSDTFVLVDGPIITANMRLDGAIASQAARNKDDTNAIITIVCSPASSGARLDSRAGVTEQLQLIINPESGQLHSYVCCESDTRVAY